MGNFIFRYDTNARHGTCEQHPEAGMFSLRFNWKQANSVSGQFYREEHKVQGAHRSPLSLHGEGYLM